MCGVPSRRISLSPVRRLARRCEAAHHGLSLNSRNWWRQHRRQKEASQLRPCEALEVRYESYEEKSIGTTVIMYEQLEA
jgi:hypothetical protein